MDPELCPKCGSMYLFDRTHYYSGGKMVVPIDGCFLCGYLRFREFTPQYSQRELPPVADPLYQKCSTKGCDKKIDTRMNNGGVCKPCRKIAALTKELKSLKGQRVTA